MADPAPAKTEALCTSIVDNRKDDPWGGDGYLSTILRAVKMHEATEYSSVLNKTEFEPALDYSTSAHKELLIKEQSAALVRHVYLILFKLPFAATMWTSSPAITVLTPMNRSRPPRISQRSSVISRNSGSLAASIPSPILQTKRRTAQKP